jgi:hypothetical protein
MCKGKTWNDSSDLAIQNLNKRKTIIKQKKFI